MKSTGVVIKKQAYRPVKGRQLKYSGMISHNGFSVFNAATFHVEPSQPRTNQKSLHHSTLTSLRDVYKTCGKTNNIIITST